MVKPRASLFTVLILGFYALRTFAVTTDPLLEKTERSIVFVESDDGRCTGFVINASAGDKGNRDLVQTASHCDGASLTVDGQPATVKAKFIREDLLVLDVEDLGKPALRLAKSDPDIMQRVVAVGYGYGLEKPLFRQSQISQVGVRLPDRESSYIAIDAGFVPGQSGGPVINQAGEVVMIVQLGNAYVGFGVGAETIRKKCAKYYEKQQP